MVVNQSAAEVDATEVTAVTEHSIRRRLGVVVCGAISGSGAGTTRGTVQSDTGNPEAASSARRLHSRTHPSTNIFAAACAAAENVTVAAEEPSHNTHISDGETIAKSIACLMPCSWQQTINSRPG